MQVYSLKIFRFAKKKLEWFFNHFSKYDIMILVARAEQIPGIPLWGANRQRLACAGRSLVKPLEDSVSCASETRYLDFSAKLSAPRSKMKLYDGSKR